MKLTNVKNIIISITVLLTVVSAQTTYNVSGIVELEDQTDSGADHSGVKVKFYNLPSMVAEDSTTSASTGAYSINISPGYYLVEWTKTGYVPWELGGLVLTANTVLDSVELIPGSVSEVSGTINTTTWTTSFVYYVTDDITVPSGQTLTINAGVRVKFSSGKGMTVNGTLIANGTASSRIIFTSRESVPAPGDWGRIYMHGTNNQLSYFDYLYAANSMRVDGSNTATNTTIDNGNFSNLGSSAYGIYLYDGGGETISNNNITVSSSNWGIYNNDSESTSITNNTITAGYGIYISNSDGPNTISNNTVTAGFYGLEVQSSNNTTISNNTITGELQQRGININSSDITMVINNHIERTEFEYDCCHTTYGIYHNNGSLGSILKGNTIIFNDSTTTDDYMNTFYGIMSERSTIDSNYIELHSRPLQWCSNVYMIQSYRSDILRNTLRATSSDECGDKYFIYSNGDSNDSLLIKNNSINFRHWGNYAWPNIIYTGSSNTTHDISYNEIKVNTSSLDRLLNLYGTTYFHNNDIILTQPHISNLILIGGGQQSTIYENNFELRSNNSNRYLLDGNGIILNFYSNIVNLKDQPAINLTGGSSGNIYNNTIISTDGDYGLHLTTSNMLVKNNNLVGFTASVYNENSTMNFNIAHNNTWDTSSPYSGTGLPPSIGNMIDVNANGTTSDIYSNISQAPLFVYPDTNNYNLQASSLLIDAGDATYTDPDGSVADIGALYYHIYVTMAHTPLESTNNTTTAYTVNATVSSTSGATVTANLTYSLDGGAATTLAMTAGTNDAFSADIPTQALNTRVQYYLTGSDGTHTVTLPRNTSDGGYDFYVNLFSNFSAISVASDIDGALTLAWSSPVPISGTLSTLKVYRNEDPNVQLTSANLLVENLDATATGYTDSNVLEGRTYYYKVVGVLSDGSESLIGPESSGISNASTIMRLRGVVHLSDASSDAPDHSGVKALFSAASPSAQSDSMVTDITGEIDIILNNGLYNIYFTKDGYQAQALGDIFMAANVVLDTVSMSPGGQTTISGNISGTLAGDTLYYASGDLNVPGGETLTIAAGAQVLFQGDYSLTANGTLLVNGTADNRVKFTSGNLAKAAGDWGGIIINKSGSRISYADIQYSSSTIYAGAIDTFTINNCLINNSAASADGIRINENLKYFTIRKNTIRANSGYGIHKVNGNSSNDGNSQNTLGGAEIVGNTIYAYTGIRIYSTYNARVDSNTILLKDQGSQGINNEYSQYSSYTNNLIMPQDEFGWYYTGMNLRRNYNSKIIGNEIRNCNDEAFHIPLARNDTISQNIVTRDWHCDQDDNHYAFYFSEQSYNNYFSENIINIHNGLYGADNDGQGYRRTHGFVGFFSEVNNHDNTFVKNNITVGIPYDDNDARYNSGFQNLGDNAVLEGNKVTAYNHCCNWSDEGTRELLFLVDGGGDQVTSTNDTLIMSEYSGGMKASNLNMTGTVISNANSAHHEYYRTIYASGSLDMDDVTITGTGNVVYFTGSSGSITKTTIAPVSGYGVNATNSGATLNIERLTLIGGGTATGLEMADGVNLNMNSSVVDGFATGLNAVSTATLYSNSFYNNSVHLSGNGIGANLGDASYFNVNGDAADIYGNIFLDPLFEDRDAGDYRPTVNSPLVDAGAAAELDLDGTVADIGHEFYNYGYAPMNLTMTSTQDGSVSISWDIVETDSITGYQPYYKEATDDTWLYDVTAATSEKNTTFTGLTNNTLYDFAVTTEYNSGSTISSRSPVLQERPGVSTMTLSPKHLIVSQDVGGTTTGDYTVSNPGSRNLTVTIDLPTDFGTAIFSKLNYADWTQAENQDRISDNVWITRQDTRGIFNIFSESEYDRDGSNNRQAPAGTEWAWGPTTGSQTYDTWYQLKNNNDIGTSDHHTMYNNEHTVSLHLIEDDLYYDVTWHFWQQSGNGGGFSYTRTHQVQYGASGGADMYQTVIEPGGSVTRTKEFNGAQAGLHVGNIAVSSDDPITPLDSIYTLNIVGPQASLPSVRFSPVDTTSAVFIYVVQEATIDGQALQTGDEIALYSGDLCVGAGVFNGVLPFLVRAYGAQSGFADGDSITVKAWDFGESRIATMASVQTGGSSTFSSGGFSAVELTGTIFYTHDIDILSGSFNLLSTYLYPQFPAAGTFFGNIEGLMIVYEDNGAAYIPDYGINTIGNVDMVEGYHLYTDGGDQTLTVSGLSIDPANWSITLQPNQFNSMAFLHSGPMDAEAALADIAGVIDIVQDDAGNAWIPELSVLMGNMTQGKGYQVFTTEDTAVTFTYAPYVAPSAKTLQPIEKPEPKYYTFRKTGIPYTIVLQEALVDDHTLEEGDEVAVYDNNLCVGAMVWNSESTNILTAWKGDEELELPGYITGHDMTFQIYKKRFKENVFVDASFPDETEQAFDGSSYSGVSLKGYPGLIPEQYALMQNYPNPFNPVTTIRYDVADDSPVTMVIYNIIGQEVVRVLNNKVHAPGKYSIIWQGTNHQGKKVSAGLYLIRMYSSGFSETRKMVLLK